MVAHIRIGDMLVAAGFVTEAQVEQALERQRETRRRLGAELLEMGFVTEVQFTQVLSNQLSVPWVSLAHVEFTRDLLNLIPAAVAQQHGVVPIYIRHVRRAGDTLFVAMQDPTDEDALAAIVATTGMPVKPMVAPPSEIDNAIRVYYLGGRVSRAPEMAPAPKPAHAKRPAPPPAPPAAKAKREPASAETPAPASSPELEPAEDEVVASAEDAAIEPEPAQSRDADAFDDSSSKPDATDASDKESWAPEAQEPKTAKRAAPRMITLTLLDGTTVRLPAPGSGGAAEPEEEEGNQALTAHDLVSALQARAQGKDVGAVLPDDRWELLFSTLLTLLIKKGLVADWEFVEEWERQKGK